MIFRKQILSTDLIIAATPPSDPTKEQEWTLKYIKQLQKAVSAANPNLI